MKRIMAMVLAIIMLLTTPMEMLASEMVSVDGNYKKTSAWETEDNDNYDTADVINVNQSYKGTIQSEYDEDCYKFTLDSAGVININFQHKNTFYTGTEWVIYVYNERLEYVAELESTGIDTNKTSVNIGVPKGSYYVMVYSDDWSSEIYTLKLNYTKSLIWETEDNDSYEIADTIKVNQSYKGVIQSKYDEDCYKFTLDSAGVININFQHKNTMYTGTEWVIYVYNERLEYVAKLESTGIDTNKTSVNIGVPKGSYYVMVYSDDWSSEIYTLKLNYTKSSTWETEDNDSYGTADVIAVGKTYSGAIQSQYDYDYYKITVKEAGNFKFVFKHDKINDTNRYWVGRLYDEKTNLKYRFDVNGTDTTASYDLFYLEKGNYYLVINSDADESYSSSRLSTADYQINFAYAFSTLKPTLKVSSIDAKKITLSWSKLDDIDGYILYRSTSKNGTYTELKKIKGKKNCSYTDTTVKTGKTYYYKLRGYRDVSGTKYYSKYSSVIGKKAVPAVTTQTPSLKVSSVHSNKIKMTWKKISSADGYIVYRSTSKKGDYKAIKTVKGKENCSYTDTTVKAGKTYYYKVRAYKTFSGTRYYSKYTSVLKVKAIPTAVKIESVKAGSKKAVIKWKKQSAISGYEIYMSTKKSSGFEKVKTIKKASTTSYKKNNLVKGRTYYFKVRSYKEVNGKKIYGKYSSVKSVKIK